MLRRYVSNGIERLGEEIDENISLERLVFTVMEPSMRSRTQRTPNFLSEEVMSGHA